MYASILYVHMGMLLYYFFLMYFVMLCWYTCVWCIVKPKTNFHLRTIKEQNKTKS